MQDVKIENPVLFEAAVSSFFGMATLIFFSLHSRTVFYRIGCRQAKGTKNGTENVKVLRRQIPQISAFPETWHLGKIVDTLCFLSIYDSLISGRRRRKNLSLGGVLHFARSSIDANSLLLIQFDFLGFFLLGNSIEPSVDIFPLIGSREKGKEEKTFKCTISLKRLWRARDHRFFSPLALSGRSAQIFSLGRSWVTSKLPVSWTS